MDRQSVSYEIGRRLRTLREERGLSYQELASALMEKYGIKISKDSLRDYEISDGYRSKAKMLPNLGMKTEYLYVLSDFYEVSADYLLGFTGIRSANPDIGTICGYTGLSESAVNCLKKFSTHKESLYPIYLFLDTLLGDNISSLQHLARCIYNAAYAAAIASAVPDDYVAPATNEELEKEYELYFDEYEAYKERIQQALGSGAKYIEIPAEDFASLYKRRAEEELKSYLKEAISVILDKRIEEI